MTTEATAIRLAGKLTQLTARGKLEWKDAGSLGPLSERRALVFKASVGEGAFAQIAEIPPPKSMTASYYFGVAQGKPELFEVNAQSRPDEIFGVFAEGHSVDPTDERIKLLSSLKSLYSVARDNAKGTRQKVEKFEKILERLA
ncbi:MAG: hypothetical protein ABR976_10540 [Terracidiphilus sp.]|jgi:hypothetical protein